MDQRKETTIQLLWNKSRKFVVKQTQCKNVMWRKSSKNLPEPFKPQCANSVESMIVFMIFRRSINNTICEIFECKYDLTRRSEGSTWTWGYFFSSTTHCENLSIKVSQSRLIIEDFYEWKTIWEVVELSSELLDPIWTLWEFRSLNSLLSSFRSYLSYFQRLSYRSAKIDYLKLLSICDRVNLVIVVFYAFKET